MPAKASPAPLTFITLEEAFEPQIKVQALKDISGPTSDPNVRWSIGAGSVGYLNEEKAREFQVKGYILILEGEVRPVSREEQAAMLAQVTTIGLGGPNG